MEDELRLEESCKNGITFAAVIDGHGGLSSAAWLQQHLYEDVVSRLDQSFLQPDPAAEEVPGRPAVVKPSKLERTMVDIFQQADNELLQHLLETKGRVTGASGATTTVALVHPQRGVFASLGDSLAVLCRNGQPLILTAQHRVYGFGDHVLEEIERVEAAGGWIVDGRVCNILAVSRAFGDPEFKGEGLQLLLNEGAEKNSWPKSFAATHKFKSDPVIPLPDVTMVDFDRDVDEFLVIATDGLWDCMPPAEAIRYARSQFKQGKSAQAVADALVEIAIKRYTTDNVAVIVADMKGADAWKARPKSNRKGLLSGFFGKKD